MADEGTKPTVEEITAKPTEVESNEKMAEEMVAPKRRWLWWLIGIIVVLGLGSALVWRMKWYLPVFNRVYAASITFKVREDDTYVVQGATLTFRGLNYTTDASGQVVIPQTVAGNWAVLVSKDGYTPYNGGVTLKRGDNSTISISISKVPESLYSFKGLIEDYVTGLAVAGAQVTFNGETAVSDAAGGVSFDKLAVGDYQLAVAKSGFASISQTVTVKAVTTADPVMVGMVPNGKVLFVSNRDGKRAIYQTTYDGKIQTQLVTPVTDTEDYGPAVSPDGKYVVFSSTRDKIADAYNNGYVPRLYIVGIDGKGLKKVSDDVSPTKVVWGETGKYFYYEAYQDAKQTTYTRRFYDLGKGSTFDLGEASNGLAINHAGNQAVYVVSRDAGDGTTLYDIKILDLTTGNRRTLVTGAANYLTSTPIALSDDDKLVYYETEGSAGRQRFQVDWNNGTIASIPLNTAPDHAYVSNPVIPTVRAFIDTRDGKKDLFSLDAANKETQITTLGVVSDVAPFRWDTSGNYLIFPVVRAGESALYIVSSAGGQVQKIVDFTPDSQPIPYY